MRISIFGLGYIGSVCAACLARDGHEIVGVDINSDKIALVNSGLSPVQEPGLTELVGQAVKSGRLRATLDGERAVLDTDISLVCVSTPSNPNGSLRLDYVKNVCREIGRALARRKEYHVVVIRSTILPGTVEDHLTPILEQESGLQCGVDFGVCMNPEFLRESTAIDDYYNPSHIVIGEFDTRSGDAVEQMYQAVQAPIVRTALPMAEMLKYVCNCFHGLKVSFANEIGNLAKSMGIDGRELMNLFCQDRRLNISPLYLRPGYGFGGSCLPKDLRALVYRAKERDLETPLLNAVLESNLRQIQRGIDMVERTGRTNVGILGLSFKPGTDDIRESPMVPLVETLVGRGYQVRVYDDSVDVAKLVGANKQFVERQLPHIASLMRPSMREVVQEADVVVVTNGSEEFRTIPEMVGEDKIIIDLVGTAHPNGHPVGGYEGICW